MSAIFANFNSPKRTPAMKWDPCFSANIYTPGPVPGEIRCIGRIQASNGSDLARTIEKLEKLSVAKLKEKFAAEPILVAKPMRKRQNPGRKTKGSNGKMRGKPAKAGGAV